LELSSVEHLATLCDSPLISEMSLCHEAGLRLCANEYCSGCWCWVEVVYITRRPEY